MPAGRAPICVEILWAIAIFANMVNTNNGSDLNINRCGATKLNFFVIKVYVGLYFVFIFLSSNAQVEKVEYFNSGEVSQRGRCDREGNKTGEWLSFYPSGVKSAIEHYDNGMLNGLVIYFYPDNVVQGKESWKMGQLTDSAWYFYPSGALHRKGQYENSRYINTWMHYFENGEIERIINYKAGLPDGATKVYHPTGTLVQEGMYSNGLESGSWKFYDSNGRLQFTGQYENGNPVGVWYELVRGKQKVYKRY